MVFQDPYSLAQPAAHGRRARSPRCCASTDIVPAEEIDGRGRRLLSLVGLAPDMAARRPRQLSGGQRQRVGLARALAVRPHLLVLDEPVAALDVSIQAQVLNLLQDLRDELGLTMLFVAHELGVVRHMCDRVAVMYLGRIMETGTRRRDLRPTPATPIRKGLLAAVPRLEPVKRQRKPVLEGEIPSPMALPAGCRFRTRCPRAERDLQDASRRSSGAVADPSHRLPFRRHLTAEERAQHVRYLRRAARRHRHTAACSSPRTPTPRSTRRSTS